MAARNVGLPGDPRTAALEWYALRSTRIFAVIDRAYGPDAVVVDRVLSVPGDRDTLDASAARTILTYAGAGRRANVLVVDADSDASLAAAQAMSRAAGGPIAAWRPGVGGSLIGTEMPQRANVVPDPRLIFAIGADTAPQPERAGRPPVALHLFPLLSPKVASPSVGAQRGLAGSLGEPMPTVDLSREGRSDWMEAL